MDSWSSFRSINAVFHSIQPRSGVTICADLPSASIASATSSKPDCAPCNPRVSISPSTTAGPRQQRLLYFHRSRKRAASASAAAPLAISHADALQYTQQLVVDRHGWTLLLKPVAGEYGSTASWRAWAMLLSGILLSMLLTAFLGAGRNREKGLASR